MSIVEKPIEINDHRERGCGPEDRHLTVLFFSHSTELGGAERGLLELVTELMEDRDVACTVVCPSDGPLVGQLQAVGASTLIETKLGLWTGESAAAIKDRIAQGSRALLKLMPTLREIDPDVVYTQTITIPWGASAAALLDKPHFWSICEFGELDHGLKFLDEFADVVEQVKSGASFIRTPSEAVRTTLYSDLGPDRVRTVYRHQQMPCAMKPSTGDFHRVGATRLAIFGSLCEGKGQIDAVQAVAELTARGREVELLLAGYSSPEYRSKLEALIDARGMRDRVRISDFLGDPYPTMLAADIILVCSRNEAFGRVVVDGMKLGRPVVYPRSGGIPEYMTDGVTGLSYSPGDIRELVQRIEDLMDDPERAAKLGAEAKRYACAKFTRNGTDVRILRDLQRMDGRTDWRVAMPKRVVASLAFMAIQTEQDISDARHQLSNYQKSHSTLHAKMRRMRSKHAKANAKLGAIENSRSFALARAISWASRRLTSRSER